MNRVGGGTPGAPPLARARSAKRTEGEGDDTAAGAAAARGTKPRMPTVISGPPSAVAPEQLMRLAPLELPLPLLPLRRLLHGHRLRLRRRCRGDVQAIDV